MPEKYAIIVGSGFDEFIDGDDGQPFVTDYGETSAPIRSMTIGKCELLTLPRHGDLHDLPPHRINYRANIVALAASNVTSVIALNTVGVITSIRQAGEVAVPDQVIDYTWGREHTVFEGGGPVEHIDFTEPFSAGLRKRLLSAARQLDIDCHDGGVYGATQGPRLETVAEIDRLERDGVDFVGMTAMPEASLAREVGLNYACLALVVNRAAGRGDMPIHDDVESSTAAARLQAIAILRQFFDQ